MTYEKKTIRKIISDINSGKIYLPSIQRKYLWKDKQILRFLDSIMLGYPIGTFLFWKVKKRVANEKEYSMYEFIKDFHDRDMKINSPAPMPFIYSSDEDKIRAVLDGQQRMTSLYIALQGSISRKIPNKRWNNDNAFKKKELYFNVHSEKINEEDISYEFKFFTKEEAEHRNKDGLIWYLVKDILKYSSEDLLSEIIIPNNLILDKVATKNISLLHTRLTIDEIINYFEIEKDSIDDVLDIFVRVNSGGTILSKTDLLFSTIVSRWDNARDQIDELLLEINKIGDGFNFNNDFIIQTCLYVLDMPISLKVETFKKKNVLKIKNNWRKIKESVICVVELLNEFGFNRENILSYNAIIPMVYFVYKGGVLNKENKCKLRKYIVISQIKKIFGGSSKSALTKIRDSLKNSKTKDFCIEELKKLKFDGVNGDRTLRINKDEIEYILDTKEIGAHTFMILSLLYPNLRYSQKGFHQDHMHPYSGFKEEKLKGLVLKDGSVMDEKRAEEWRRKRDTLPNLQLLEGRENESKNAAPLVEWIKKPENKEVAKYMPKDISYELSNFEEFMEKRKELMKKALIDILI